MSNKIGKFFIISSLVVATFSLSLSFSNIKKLDSTPSLGIFKDLTHEEIVNYYSSLPTNTSGDSLLENLQPILEKNQKNISNSAAMSNWKNYLLLDRDWVKSPLTENEISSQTWAIDNVYCQVLYETEPMLYTKGVTNANNNVIVDREHVWCQSRGFNLSTSKNEKPYAATDMQNLHMGEHANNTNGHNNLPYGDVANKSTAKEITSKISSTVTGWIGNNSNGIEVYEPLEKDKGDIARTIFYMAARYHTYKNGTYTSPSLLLSDDVNRDTITAETTSTTPATYGMKTDLLKWNKLDPVDEHEMHRNNLCYNAINFNRNPFIDYPLWADVAFQNLGSIDLSKENGIVGEEIKDEIFISNPITNNGKDDKGNPIEFKVNDSIDLSGLVIEYYDELGIKSTLDKNKYSIYIVDSSNTETLYSNDYVFPTKGTYSILIKAIIINKEYKTSYQIKVIEETKDNTMLYIILGVIGGVILLLLSIILIYLKKKFKIKTPKKRKTTKKKKK